VDKKSHFRDDFCYAYLYIHYFCIRIFDYEFGPEMESDLRCRDDGPLRINGVGILLAQAKPAIARRLPRPKNQQPYPDKKIFVLKFHKL
jgi:hypothetical protein